MSELRLIVNIRLNNNNDIPKIQIGTMIEHVSKLLQDSYIATGPVEATYILKTNHKIINQ